MIPSVFKLAPLSPSPPSPTNSTFFFFFLPPPPPSINPNPPQLYYVTTSTTSTMFFHLCIALALSSLLLASFASSSPSASLSFYEVLRSHGLPMGLLPKGVADFVIDDDGRFEVHLDQACNAKFESELHYDRNVSGCLSYGQIGELSGISAQELFLWFPVKGIRVDVPSSGLIYFDVGVVFKQFSLSLFETPPDCKEVHGDEQPPEGSHSVNLSGELRFLFDQEDLVRDIL